MRNRFVFVMLLALTLLASALMFAAQHEKVLICHQDSDDPANPVWITIEVAQSAVDAHLAHGDVLGACEVPPPPPVVEPPAAQ